MPALAPLRRRIFRSYFLTVALYAAAMAALLGAAVHIDSGISPKILYRNYDSIRAAHAMLESWHGMQSRPSDSSQVHAFQAALDFEKSNLTEPGEADLVNHIENLWALGRLKGIQAAPQLPGLLKELIQLNETGMQRLAAQARQQGRRLFAALLFFFALSLAVTLLVVRRLASSLSSPLIQISRTLESSTPFQEELKLPQPNSLELQVLVERLRAWWLQIREGQRAMLEQRDAQERQRRERLENEFVGVLSHELKTPLQSLGSAAELLASKKEKLDPSLHLFVDTILEDLGRIRSVANDFVQVSQLNVRSIRLKLEPVDLKAKLMDWMRPFEVLARDKGVRLSFEAGGSAAACLIDPLKFSWVLSNLLSNALRVSSSGQELRVRLEDQKLYTELRVEDEGPGVEPSLRERMFEPYVQGSAEGRSAGLLGLGLAIAKEIVEAHEGAIEYFPGSSGGSVFRVLLPFAQGPLRAELRP
jgi:signal transduction histidine kinase